MRNPNFLRRILLDTLEQRTLMSSVGGGTVDYDGHKGLTIKGSKGADVIHVDCAEWTTDSGEYLRNWYISINDEHTSYNTLYIYDIAIDGMGGNDKIEVGPLPTGMYVNVNTSGHVGTASSLKVTQMSTDKITWTGGGDDTLDFRAPDYSGWKDFTLTNHDVQVYGTPRVLFSGVKNVNFTGSFEGEKIHVNSVAAGQTFKVSGQQSNDTIYVGNGDIAKNIRGFLTVDGGHEYGADQRDTDSLVVEDASGPAGIYTLDYNKLSKTGLPNQVQWLSFDSVTLNASNQDDYINLDSAAVYAVKINGDGGNDNIRVGGGGKGNLGFVQTSPITINGGAGNDNLTANDAFASGPKGYIINAKGFRAGNTPLWGVESIAKVTLLAGSGNNFVNAFAAGESVAIYCQGGDDYVLGGPHDDSLYGGAGSDSLWGRDGNDRIQGDAGKDFLYGGDGVDSMFARDGEKDHVDGGPQTDVFDKDAFDA